MVAWILMKCIGQPEVYPPNTSTSPAVSSGMNETFRSTANSIRKHDQHDSHEHRGARKMPSIVFCDKKDQQRPKLSANSNEDA